MTNKEIEKIASEVWDKLAYKPYEIGKSLGEGMKMLEKLNKNDNQILLVDLDKTLNDLKACSTEAVNRFICMLLIDFSILSNAAEANYNNAKTQEEKEESEATWRNMMAYKINTHKYKLEDMAVVASSIERKILAKLKDMYPVTHQYVSTLTQDKIEPDTRLEGFKKINEEDIMD